jgi:polyketide cyclase/dehydrase/lipid transport protein
MRRLFLLVLGLATSTVVPAFADAPADAPVITPIQAGAIFDDVWTQREVAIVQRNRTALASVEEGPALDYDLAWMDGQVSNRPGGSGERGLVGQVLVVPRQLAYPSFFVASASVTTRPDPTSQYLYWTALLVVVRDDATSAWRIRLETWAAGPPQANELQAALATDQPEQFAAMPANRPENIVDQMSRRYRDYAAQAVKPGDLFSVAAPAGGTIVCFGRSYIDHESPPWWNPAKARPSDRRGIPQGDYRSLTSTYEEQRCGLAEANGEESPTVSLLTSEGAYISHQETPATPPPWLPLGLAGCLIGVGVFAAVWRLRRPTPGAVSRDPDVITLAASERHTVLSAALRVLLAALVLVEVERWLLSWNALFGGFIAVFIVLPYATRLIPARRIVRFTARILIPNPADEVYAFVADLRNEPKWQPMVLAVEQRPSTGPDRVYHSRQRVQPHLVLEYDTLASAQPEQKVLRYTLVGKWFPEGAEWRFTSVPGGTVVTLVRWFELGPLRAIAFGLQRFRQGLKRMTIGDLNELKRVLLDEPKREQPAEIPIRQIGVQYSVLKSIPGIGQSDLGVTVASFLACWILYGRLTTDWFATGVMVMLLVHELGHYVQGRRAGFKPLPPVFILGGAFVYFPGARMDSLTHARMSLAGGLAGTLASAVTLCLYVLTGSPHLLPWVEAGAAANLFGSLLPFVTYDVESILGVVGKWLPVLGVFAAAGAWLMAAALGVGDFVIPVIVALAFVVLRMRQPGRFLLDGGGLPARARLVIAGSWLALVAYLWVLLVLTAGWLN